MKKKILSYILVLCFMLSSSIVLTACENPPPADPPPAEVVYTVTESQWEINFNITKTPIQQNQPLSHKTKNSAQLFSDNSTSLAEITSYTLRAEGNAGEDEGSALLKVAPNGMYMEFYVNGELSEGETGTTPSTDPWYVGMTTMLKSYFPFSGKYNDFTFDETKNAYVAENLVSTVVDESDITKTYDLYNKKVEITFINGYLNTVSIEMCEDNTFTEVCLDLVFTFSDINATTVEI